MNFANLKNIHLKFFSGVDVDDIVVSDSSESVLRECLNVKKTTIGEVANHFSSVVLKIMIQRND